MYWSRIRLLSITYQQGMMNGLHLPQAPKSPSPDAHRANRWCFPAMPCGGIQPVIIQVTCTVGREEKCNGFEVEKEHLRCNFLNLWSVNKFHDLGCVHLRLYTSALHRLWPAPPEWVCAQTHIVLEEGYLSSQPRNT